MRLHNVAVLCIFIVACCNASSTWHYDDNGKDWTGTCATGKVQSPVYLSQVVQDSTLKPINYSSWSMPTTFHLINNGHTIQVQDFSTPSYLMDPNTGIRYQLSQFHFHSPSEHIWGSSIVDLEVHLVHVRVGGNVSNGDDILVLGMGLTSSEFGVNEFLAPFWTDLASVALNGTADVVVQKTLRLRTALPESTSYVTYTGSLTTPPCTEGVHWYIMEAPVILSQPQVEYIRNALNLSATENMTTFEFQGNRRLPQPLNGRALRGYTAVESNPTATPPIEQSEESSIFQVITLLNTIVLLFVLYSVRHLLELPFYGRLMKASPRKQSSSSAARQDEVRYDDFVAVAPATETTSA